MLLFAHLQDTLDFNGLENTSFPINIVKRSLLRLYRLLQVDRTAVPCRKRNRTIADLRYGRKAIISPSTQIFAPIKG